MARKQRSTRPGKTTRVLDDETLEGWESSQVFVTCNKRGELYHRAKSTSLNILAVTMETWCGARVYNGASMRRDWEGVDAVSVCIDCVAKRDSKNRR